MKIPKLKIRYRLILYLATVVFAALSLLHVVFRRFPEMLGILLYVLAACSLFVSCCYIVSDMKYGINEKVRPMIEANSFTNRMSRDYGYRTVMFAVPGLILNMIFAIFNGVVAVISRSPWMGTLAAYYIILSVMRYSAVAYDRRMSKIERTKEVMLDEIAVYRRCGILFVLMTVVLSGAVILMVNSKGGKSYPGYTIFVVAAYTFYKIGVSICNVIKVGRLKQPLLMAIRNIGYVDACVSILTLQTAMFASFGQGMVENERQMNAVTGAVVCLMVLAVGIRSIVLAGKMKKKEKSLPE